MSELLDRPWGQNWWVEPYDPKFNTREYLLSKSNEYHRRLEDTPRMTEVLEEQCEAYNINQRWVIARGTLEQQIWKWLNTASDFEERINEMLGFRLWDNSCMGWENQIVNCCKALRTQYLNPDDSVYYIGNFIETGIQMVHGSGQWLFPMNFGEALDMRYNPSESGLSSFTNVYLSWFPDYAAYGIMMYDKSVSNYAKPAALWAKENNLIKGFSDDNFAGRNHLTREQLAVILCRFDIYLKNKE